MCSDLSVSVQIQVDSKAWVVERPFAWLHGQKISEGLLIDYEYHAGTNRLFVKSYLIKLLGKFYIVSLLVNVILGQYRSCKKEFIIF